MVRRGKCQEIVLRRSERIKNMRMLSAPNKRVAETEKELLPHELIIEILIRLPVKCLIRFKCVCKLWFEVIQEQYFIDKHLQVTKSIYLYPDEGCLNRHGGGETFSHVDTLNGLLLERSSSTSKYRIRNPETRQILDVPNPHPREECLYIALFYLPVAKKYKLLCIYKTKGTKFRGRCKVLTVETELKWRTLSCPSLNDLDSRKLGCAVCGDASICNLIRYDNAEIILIDMESECLISVKIPEVFLYDLKSVQLLSWEGKFSLAKVEEDKEGEWKLNVWVLEDHRKQKWAEEKIVIPSEFMRNHANTELTLMQVTGNWLGLYLGDYTHHLWYDIKSKETKINSAPSGERFSGYSFQPSLVCLEGMRRE